MKKLLIFAVALIGALCFTSCESTSVKDIAGTWNVIEQTIYFDGNKLSFDASNDAVFYLDENKDTECIYSSMDNLMATMPFNFNADGWIYVMGMQMMEWSCDKAGNIFFKDSETGISAKMGYVLDDNLYLEMDVEQAYGYQIMVDDFYGETPTIDDWLGYDGNLHEIKLVIKYAK